MKPRVHVIASGGTIASTASGSSELFTPAMAGEELVRAVPGLRDVAEVTVENFSKVLSPNLTVEQVWGIGRRVAEVLRSDPTLAGVVVTHGTSTMEETAYMADLLVDDPRPVVFTGAMRGASSPFSDGPYNLLNAVRIAGSREARGMGVMIALNERIHAAREVIKSHTTSGDTFQSGEFGPLGYVYPDRIHFARAPLLRQHVAPEAPESNVDLIKFAVGMDDRFIQASIAAGARGIVIEGSGLGNVNDAVAAGAVKAVEAGLAVVICSRCRDGRVYGAYGTRAGGAALREAGCIMSSLPGTKSRLLLMLALGAGRAREEMRTLFDPTGALV